MKPSHVLQLEPLFKSNANSLSDAILKALSPDCKTTVAFLDTQENIKPGLVPSGAHYFPLHVKAKDVKGLRRLKYVKKIFEYCQQEKVDVLISHRFKPLHLLSLVARRMPFQKKIAIMHGTKVFDKFTRKLLARWLMKSFTFVAVSQAVKEDLLNAGCGLKAEQIVVIHNAIDVQLTESTQLNHDEARSALNLPKDAFIFGHVGRLVNGKGQNYLIEAFHKANIPNSHLVIIGDGYAEQGLRAQINTLQLKDKVHLLGEIPNAYRYMKAFDTFVLPSLQESFGMVLLEAMAASLPIIAATTEGIPEVLGDLGYLCAPADSDTLAAALKKFQAMSTEEAQHMGQQLNKRLHQHFDIQRYYEDYRKLCGVI